MSIDDSAMEDSLIRTAFARVPRQSRYSIGDLESLTGFSARTIRFYIQEGLLSAAIGRGPSATYERDHLLRLLRIAELKTHIGALAEIKAQLETMTTAELEAHFAVQAAPEEERWRRVRVHPQLELHVRESDDRSIRFEQALEQIMQHARIVLEHYESGRS